MSTTSQLAKHLHQVYFGGNWTVSTFREHLKDVTWQEATTQVHGFNTIALLTYHSGYYVQILLDVLSNKPLSGSDKDSFNVPPIKSQADWDELLNTTWQNAEAATKLIEQLPDEKLAENFVHEKYGTYYRNIAGTIEHLHYHLGQIVLIKKLLNPSTT